MKFNSSTFQHHLESLLENTEQNTFLLAISGGVDSMVLLDLLLQSNLKFQVAHVNYGLRGEDSDWDENLVESVCEKNNIPFHCYKVSEKDQKPENSIQVWARNLRYDFFKTVLEKENLDYIVTAHHLNDQLETFFINLSRGSGIKGLSGIPEHKNKILRPLLPFSKKEIYDFAKENFVEFREDKSNQKNDYLRNQIRNEIVPQFLKTNESFLQNFKNSLDYLQQTKLFVKDQINSIFDQLIVEETEEKLILDKEHLEKQTDFVKFEILQKFGFEKMTEVEKIFAAETGKSFYSKYFQLTINRNELIITENKTHQESFEEIVLIENESDLISKNYFVAISEEVRIEQKTDLENAIWKINTQKIQFPLRIRHRKQGDVFYPTGMFGKKKVSKFFKDEKFSVIAKQKIWLLCDGNDDILGIIPMRQDRRFVGNKNPEKTLTIKL